jgi:hypothetical protein
LPCCLHERMGIGHHVINRIEIVHLPKLPRLSIPHACIRGSDCVRGHRSDRRRCQVHELRVESAVFGSPSWFVRSEQFCENRM